MLNVFREDFRLEILMIYVRLESFNRLDILQEYVRLEIFIRFAILQVNVILATFKVSDFFKFIVVQDILKCDFCQEDDAVGEMYCKICVLYLCIVCVSRYIEFLISICFYDIVRYKFSRDFIRFVCDFYFD